MSTEKGKDSRSIDEFYFWIGSTVSPPLPEELHSEYFSEARSAADRLRAYLAPLKDELGEDRTATRELLRHLRDGFQLWSEQLNLARDLISADTSRGRFNVIHLLYRLEIVLSIHHRSLKAFVPSEGDENEH